jgi:glutamine amidotransferase
MCELLGMSANVPTDICFSFSGLLERGGRTGPHADGWGIAFYEGKGVRSFRDPMSSCHSEVARFVKCYPIKSHIVISHIRQANRGRVCLENTHPFFREMWGRYWTFAHNGQLKGIKKWPLGDYLPVGSTDSEYAFCWLLDQIKQRFPHPPQNKKVLWRFINACCDTLSELGVFNLLLSDATYLYAYRTTKLCWITRKAPFGEAKLIDTELALDFAKVTTPDDVVTVIASQPLTHDEVWHPLDKNQLMVFRKGQIVYAS